MDAGSRVIPPLDEHIRLQRTELPVTCLACLVETFEPFMQRNIALLRLLFEHLAWNLPRQ